MAHAESASIAGLKPYERPASAPRMAELPASAEQVAHDLRGISAPVPGNLQSIAATGHWFVPLRRRGMSPPYDPRDLHGSPPPAPQGGAAPAGTAASGAR